MNQDRNRKGGSGGFRSGGGNRGGGGSGGFRSGGGGRFGGGNSGGFRRNNFNDGPREMHKAVCSDCKQDCEVPFKPTQGKPVYCKECFSKHKKF